MTDNLDNENIDACSHISGSFRESSQLPCKFLKKFERVIANNGKFLDINS